MGKKKKKNKVKITKPNKKKCGGLSNEEMFFLCSKIKLNNNHIGVLSTTSKNNHIGIYAGDGKWFENSVVWGVQLTNFKSFKYFFRIKNID